MYRCEWCGNDVIDGRCTNPYGRPCPPPSNGRGWTLDELRAQDTNTEQDAHNGAGAYDADLDFA